MVEGGSEKAFAQWLAERPQSFCEKVEAVAMDAFAGYKKAAARQVPHAVEILDPFHIVKLAGDKVTAVRCRLQREATGRRGTRTDPLYRGRRILLKTASLRTDRQKKRADELLGDPSNKPLALAHGVYQKIIACYAQEDRGKGRGMMAELIECLCSISCCGFSHDDFSGLGRACRPRNGLNWMVLVSPPERTGKDYDQHAPSTVYPSFAAERGIRRVDRAENTCQRADGA